MKRARGWYSAPIRSVQDSCSRITVRGELHDVLRWFRAACIISFFATSATARAVELSGQLTCAGCTGPIAIGAFAGDAVEAAAVLDLRWLSAPGAFVLEVPEGVGPVWVFAFDDPGLEGVPAPGAAFGEAADNPYEVGAGPVDVGIVTLVTPELPVVSVSGTVTCTDCDGAIAVVFHEAPGPDGGALMDAFWLTAPGAWQIDLPEHAGELWVSAMRDGDFDRVPDLGTALVTASPITVAMSDVAGLDLTLETLPTSGVVLSGTVGCAGCTPPIGLVLLGPPGAPDGPLLERWWLETPGAFSVRLPEGLGEVWLYGFLDADLDGVPDLGSDLVAYAGNPITIDTSPVGGVALTLAAPVAPGAVELRGTLSCTGCRDIIWIEARGDDALGGAVIDRRGLVAPGAFMLVVPEHAGRVRVFARASDGAPEVEAVPSPVTVATADVTGLRIDLGVIPDGVVAVSGVVTCADCAGPIAVAARDGFGGNLASLWLVSPGPYTLLVPEAIGEVSVFAWRDADLDGQPDAGGDEVPAADNPIAIGTSDVAGVDVDLGALPLGPTISGTVACDGCTGHIAVALFAAPGPAEGALLDRVWLAAPGAWLMPLPDAAEVWVAAFADADLDGEPDVSTGLVSHPNNPVVLDGASVTGIDLTLEVIAPPRVTVGGEVICRTCPGIVWVRVFDGPIDQSQVLDDFGLVRAGPFERAYPPGLGAAWFYAFPDADLDREPDFGFEPVAFADNPVAIGEDDIDGVILDLDPEPIADEDPESVEPVETVEDVEPDPVEPDESPEPTEPGPESTEPEPDAPPELVEEAADEPRDSGCGCDASGGPSADILFSILCLAALLRRRARSLEVPR